CRPLVPRAGSLAGRGTRYGDDLAVALELLAPERGERLWRHAFLEFGAIGQEVVPKLGRGHDGVDRLVQALHHGLGQTLGAGDPAPERVVQPAYPDLVEGRHVGQRREAFTRRYG